MSKVKIMKVSHSVTRRTLIGRNVAKNVIGGVIMETNTVIKTHSTASSAFIVSDDTMRKIHSNSITPERWKEIERQSNALRKYMGK